MGEFEKTQWHPPFYAGMKLELRENKNELIFNSEVILNTKPIQMDMLVVEKTGDVQIRNEIGRIFRQHNIFEYKSPDDQLGVDEYYKTLAYACLYKAAERGTDSIRDDDLTLSLVRERKPRKLLQWVENNGGARVKFFSDMG